NVRTVHFAGATFPYSTRRFLFAYPAERQECLFDAIERVYQQAGGLSERVTLDNTPLAVAKVLKGRRREETTEYNRFRGLLGIRPRYTNRAAGWEKGHVEGTVGWAKRQHLLDLETSGWEELWEVLEEGCEEDARERRHGESGKFVKELFEEERQLLRPFPYEGKRSYRRVRAQVSPGGLVHADGSRYSVPVGLRGRFVRLHLFWNEVVATFDRQEVARHPRDWTGRGEHYQVEHYLELLKRAPALLDHGKPFTRMPDWLQETRRAMADDKSLVELLLAVDTGQYTFEELEGASREALRSGCVKRAVIEQRALASRSDSGERAELEREECGELGRHHFSVESPEIYNAILNTGSKAKESAEDRAEEEVA
ncbi:MAG: hypothetical protein ACE5FA_14840, partial [Dehalococcoidia bacterium]